MFNRLALTFGLICLTLGCGSSGGTGPAVDQPYDSCSAGDECSLSAFACSGSTLPSSSYTGSFCTSTCASDSDCYQGVSNYPATCVLYAAGTGQCYLTCGADSSCPYGQACFTYQDGFTGNPVSLCTP